MSKVTGTELVFPELDSWEWGEASEIFPSIQEFYERSCKEGAKVALDSIKDSDPCFMVRYDDSSVWIDVLLFDHITIFENFSEVLAETAQNWPREKSLALATHLRKLADRISRASSA